MEVERFRGYGKTPHVGKLFYSPHSGPYLRKAWNDKWKLALKYASSRRDWPEGLNNLNDLEIFQNECKQFNIESTRMLHRHVTQLKTKAEKFLSSSQSANETQSFLEILFQENRPVNYSQETSYVSGRMTEPPLEISEDITPSVTILQSIIDTFKNPITVDIAALISCLVALIGLYKTYSTAMNLVSIFLMTTGMLVLAIILFRKSISKRPREQTSKTTPTSLDE